MNKNLLNFGKHLNELRFKNELSIREICKAVNYDPSNWSKIERGVLSPPSNERILGLWAEELGLSRGTNEYSDFIDLAKISQGIIPDDVLTSEKTVEYLPAFFRTLRNKKPTKEEMDNLIKIIKGI